MSKIFGHIKTFFAVTGLATLIALLVNLARILCSSGTSKSDLPIEDVDITKPTAGKEECEHTSSAMEILDQ